MRKMRLAKREIQEKKRLMEILEQAKVLRIGTMDQEGIYIVPVITDIRGKKENL